MTILADAFERIEESQSRFEDHLNRRLWPGDPTNSLWPGLRHNQRIHEHCQKISDHLAAASRAAMNQYRDEGNGEGGTESKKAGRDR